MMSATSSAISLMSRTSIGPRIQKVASTWATRLTAPMSIQYRCPPAESDGVFDAAVAEAAVADILPPVFRGARDKFKYAIAVPSGTVKYYEGGSRFVAECNHHTERGGKKCVLERTGRSSDNPRRAGQGRPLGQLVAWLGDFPPGICKDDHVHAFTPTLARRQAARRCLLGLPSADAEGLRSSERHKRTVDESDEPDVVP